VSVLGFLLVPLVVIVIASAALVLRHRPPKDARSSIESFRREMEALAPDDEPRRGG
jgi:hypothetical protein